MDDYEDSLEWIARDVLPLVGLGAGQQQAYFVAS
jgi:hypothetical protein